MVKFLFHGKNVTDFAQYESVHNVILITLHLQFNHWIWNVGGIRSTQTYTRRLHPE